MIRATKPALVGRVGDAEMVVDRWRGIFSEQGSDVLPALNRFAVVTKGGASLGFFDQQRQMGLDAPGEVMVEGGMEVLNGWFGLIGQ
ncbi:MAG: hypothetical protein KFB97_14525 [Cyanobium sp. M30B3]|nr:MAG: hypothetical protein KFB97_14525 [Cyanobium sp. M30B3]